jgi:hypothetical protein
MCPVIPKRSALDIRDHPDIGHDDIVALNFIRPNDRLFFRRHYRHGLRSHIMEVLVAKDVRLETQGHWVDGIRYFPRARPLKMLRLFRSRFGSREQALDEIRRLQILDRYLADSFYARSIEFIVDYRGPEGYATMLCGLQEYVPGEDLDPWHHNPSNQLPEICRRLITDHDTAMHLSDEALYRRIQGQIALFVERIKRMVRETGHIPDLAGIGNILITAAGTVKLVDINNISQLAHDHGIPVDDKGYPVCDKSVEALYLLETHFIGGDAAVRNDPLYRVFLDPQRMRDVRRLEQAFIRSLNPEKPIDPAPV